MTRLAVLTLLLASPGCSMLGVRAADATNAGLAEARTRWAASGPDAYTMTQSRSCFCPREVTGPFEVVVRDGAVASVLLDGFRVQEAQALTVDGLFDLIADAYARDAAEVRVTYHPTLGYPTDLWIDYDRQMADEETGYAITALAPAP